MKTDFKMWILSILMKSNELFFLIWKKLFISHFIFMILIHNIASILKCHDNQIENLNKLWTLFCFRYRCLKCFNFDVCQNCFFSGRKVKSHKLSHHMQEYCTSVSNSLIIEYLLYVILYVPFCFYLKHCCKK